MTQMKLNEQRRKRSRTMGEQKGPMEGIEILGRTNRETKNEQQHEQEFIIIYQCNELINRFSTSMYS